MRAMGDCYHASQHADASSQGIPSMRNDAITRETKDDNSNVDDETDAEEHPLWAFVNAHQPMRQPSEDAQEIERLVQSLQEDGVIPIDG